MAKKKFNPPNGINTQKRRLHWLLLQRPKAYPQKPRSNKKHQIKPIRRS